MKQDKFKNDIFALELIAVYVLRSKKPKLSIPIKTILNLMNHFVKDLSNICHVNSNVFSSTSPIGSH